MPLSRSALIGKLDATAKDKSAEHSAVDQRVEPGKRRLASLRSVAGIWAGRTDIPADGLQYERDLRDEWR